MSAPPHPADFLNEVLMPATGRSDSEVARLLGISLSAFYTILTRERPISRSTAEMLGRLFHTGVDFWLQMQAEYDRSVAPQIVVDGGARGIDSRPAPLPAGGVSQIRHLPRSVGEYDGPPARIIRERHARSAPHPLLVIELESDHVGS